MDHKVIRRIILTNHMVDIIIDTVHNVYLIHKTKVFLSMVITRRLYNISSKFIIFAVGRSKSLS